MHEAFATARDRDLPLGLLMIDLDHFKSVNDRYGHRAGDAVLLSAADATRRCLRETDTLVRYGGEEFVAILPGIGPDRLGVVAERVRQAIAASGEDRSRRGPRDRKRGWSRAGQPPRRVGDELIDRADRALYAAKAGGRDRVVMAAPLAVQGL